MFDDEDCEYGVCQQCQGRLRFLRNQRGESIDCPHCHAQTVLEPVTAETEASIQAAQEKPIEDTLDTAAVLIMAIGGVAGLVIILCCVTSGDYVAAGCTVASIFGVWLVFLMLKGMAEGLRLLRNRK